MSIENWFLKEDEKKKKELSEKEIQESNKKRLEYKKTKEKISTQVDTEESLMNLKDLVEKWIISKETAKNIIDWENIDEEVIQEMFNKINEIEDIKDIDNYLPAELRITKEEYKQALNDDIFRVQTITKLDSALTLLANQINPESAMWLNLFSWFLTVLDKNLVKVQENTIDIKDNLKEIDKKKNINKNWNISIWRKILEFLKELFD